MDALRNRLGDLLEPIPDDETLPIDFSRKRLRVERPAVVATAVIAVLVVIATAIGLFVVATPSASMPEVGAPVGAANVVDEKGGSSVADAVGAGPHRPGAAGAVAPADGDMAPPSTIVVSVVGLVHRPGVVTVAGTARVADAIDLAGGMLPEANPASVVLAAPLQDGQQIVVGADALPATGGVATIPGAETGGGAASGVAGADVAPGSEVGSSAGGLININTATESELEELTGIGPATAKKIVSHREQNGPFVSVDQLEEVPGIGPAKLETLRSEATV
ncbi:ComEA family DNA-binding protein [Corynebacterium sp. H113]|uniref:ComEA family DNA-binding protein n=1 Tax=Corynebacterium sp. H113 TaxID=3133419 RepID=UPI0030A6FBD2